MGTFYVVGTPIGNLEDLTRRAARVLGEVNLIAAEDTRVTRKLLNHLGLRVRTTSCHQHNWQSKLPSLLSSLESGDVALVTDAGMPGVSDPGSDLISAINEAGYPVEVVPGVSSVTTAVAASGMPGDAFVFLGFLPRRARERKAALEAIAPSKQTLVILESPHRVLVTLRDLQTVLGERPIAVCRELTKLHEEVFRGTISQAIDHFDAPRGEFVLVVSGASQDQPSETEAAPDLTAVQHELTQLRQSGVKAKEAVAQAAEASGLSKNAVYQLWLQTARR